MSVPAKKTTQQAAPFADARAHASSVEGILRDDMTRKRHSDVEDFLDQKGREWARLMYEST